MKKNKKSLISISVIIITLVIISIVFLTTKQEIGTAKGATSSIHVYYYKQGADRSYEIEEGASIQSSNICISGRKDNRI